MRRDPKNTLITITMAELNDLEQYMNDDSFVRWITGKASREDSERWESWESQSADRQALVSEARSIIRKAIDSEPAYPDPEKELRKLRLTIDQYDLQKELANFEKYGRKNTPVYIAVAAVMAIIIGVMVLYNVIKKNDTNVDVSNSVASVQEFQTDYGQKSTLKLSDGSTIILNANSNLKFASDLDQKGEVDIWLKGEAYFSIPHLTGRNKRTLKIHTKDGTIIDLGTQFSVNTRSDSTSVALVEGQVKIAIATSVRANNGSYKDTAKNNSVEYTVNPSEVAVFKEGVKKVDLRHVNPELYTSWITNKLVFDHTPLWQIIRRIENTYGVKVVVDEPRLLNKTLSGSLANSNLDVLEEAMGHALKIPVYQQGKVVYIGK